MRDNRILVVSNDFQFYNLIQNAVQESGMGTCEYVAASGVQSDFPQYACSLIIVDIRNLDVNGSETVCTVRKIYSMPILVLTEKVAAKNKIALFQAGANACLEMPIDLSVCVAQADSLIQLYMEAQEKNRKHKPLNFGDELIIDPTYRQVIIDGELLELTRTEFELLYYMAGHCNQIFSRQQLYQQIWSDDLGIDGEHTVKTNIGNLKKKLTALGKGYIQNSRGIGYKFVPPNYNA